MKAILLFFILFATSYIIIFLLPNHVNNFALIAEKVKQGEFWRFFTHPFSHLNLTHLISNLIAFAIAVVLALELKTKFPNFSITYVLAGFLAVLPLWFLLQFTILGASAAIYAAFGLLSGETAKYKIRIWLILGVFSILIFFRSFITLWSFGAGDNFIFSIEQALSHFSGLIFGFLMFILFIKIDYFLDKKKSYLLRRL